MKPWIKVLMWFGLGGSLGYVIGKRYGYTKAKKEDEEIVNEAYDRGLHDGNPLNGFADKVQELKDNLGYLFPEPDERNVNEDIIQGLRAKGNPVDEYAGDEFHMVDIPEDDPIVEVLTPVHPEGEDDEEDAEMPTEEPAIDDLDNLEAGYYTTLDDPMNPEQSGIPPFHPTYVLPQIVTQEEYDSRGDLDEKVLIFYEGDEVLYCTEDQKPMGEEDQYSTIGIGTLNEFHAGPGAAKDEIYVINETYGRFKIIRVDGAFVDEVDGIAGPEDDDEESDRFWNNGDC